MAHFIKDPEDFWSRVKFYYNIGQRYTYEICGNSAYLTNNWGVTYYTTLISTRGGLPLEQLTFIVMVKKYIMGNSLHKKIKPNYRSKKKIRYSASSDKKEGTFKKCYSVDITKAYWRAAYLSGFLSDKLYLHGILSWKEALEQNIITQARYDKAMNKRYRKSGKHTPDEPMINKKVRLAALGSFAKNKKVYKYDGKRENMIGEIKPEFPHIFFNQANIIYKLMEGCRGLAKNDFLFYWTDGIYVRSKKAAEMCKEWLEKQNYPAVIKPIRKIEHTEKGWVTFEKRINHYNFTAKKHK